MSQNQALVMDELTIFQRPDPTTDVLEWPCIQLENISIYADTSSSFTDITDVDNEDDIDNYTVEGDLVSVASVEEPKLLHDLFDDLAGTRVRIYNVHTTILKKLSAHNLDNGDADNVTFDMDFQVLGEASWYRCLSPSKEYRNIYSEIIDKTKFWSWITAQMADISPTESGDDFDLFENLNLRYRHDFNQMRFHGLLLKHHRFIISRLLKDKYWENDILLHSFLTNPEYGPVVIELSKKINDAAINIDEKTSDYLKNNIKLRAVASRKRKRRSVSPESAASLSSTPDRERGGRHVSPSLSASPRSASVSAMFGLSPSLTVSNVLSFVVHRSANIFDAAAHVLILCGPKAPELVVNSDEFLSHMRQFLERELLFTESSWKQLMTDETCMNVFNDRISSHLDLIESKKDVITDKADYDLYVTYVNQLKVMFESRLQVLQTVTNDDQSSKRDVIITNEEEGSDQSGSSPSKLIRRSQKAVSRLRPFGSPALTNTGNSFPAGDDSDSDDDQLSFKNDGSFGVSTSQNAGSKPFFPQAGFDLNWFSGNDHGGISSSISSATDVPYDDGIRLKKSADEAMFVAITLGIQRRLTNAFKLVPVSDNTLSMLPPKRWACPQDECPLEIQNANSPEGRECIQEHYQAHVDQYLSAMETVRLIGAGQHVENLLAKIDNMADLWSNEQSKLTIATSSH
ncbi:hypothetical protein POJ06DRAFT_17419 [Lipomyces tetrasporus]|uniref:Uncharacterized protein n=1 Tax=Lipomyces tetrasporus TaxID=54092 RepID=A0AAD7QZK8_9ASCO|nr:uncharacterized protein POJ06DRAFT_17419 [Lipomyces tetrasporus]KAJ8104295.1 hypothetical protein POJ06DRAFT_17419 [Lipomyces tetrasporus]